MDFVKLCNIEGFEWPILISPTIFKDERGYFFESYNEEEYKKNLGNINFVQDNESKSLYGTLRGLHFQRPPYAQAKLVRVVKGSAMDVVVDIRKNSPLYGKFFTAYLSEDNHRQLFVPRGFAHGFVALANNTIFQYKCDNFYNKESEGSINFNDPDIAIPWGQWINFTDIKLSEKDKNNKLIEEIENPF